MLAGLQQQLCAGAVFCFFKGCVWGWIMVGWPLGFGCLVGLLFYESRVFLQLSEQYEFVDDVRLQIQRGVVEGWVDHVS